MAQSVVLKTRKICGIGFAQCEQEPTRAQAVFLILTMNLKYQEKKFKVNSEISRLQN